MVEGYFWSEGGLKKFIHIHGLDGSISNACRQVSEAGIWIGSIFV